MKDKVKIKKVDFPRKSAARLSLILPWSSYASHGVLSEII